MQCITGMDLGENLLESRYNLHSMKYGNLIEITDPKIYGATVAIVVGYLSRNIIATIFSGLISYWIIIFII